ncbi:MAG TPA: hypothetical protein VHR72_07400 [Gemmataceae bacterium]|nr:hypothetical protein [Gemmataceae bacterium]
MTSSQMQPPPTKRSFANPWGELDYLCRKLRYWLYTRSDKGRAERFVGRLEKVLRKVPEESSAILRQEALAILCEMKDQIGHAIAYRQSEIELMLRLQELARSEDHRPEVRNYMLKDRGPAELRDRQKILKSLQKSITT